MNCSLFQNIHKDTKITGRIYISGNQPFTQLTLEDNQGEIFYLQCDEKLKKDLWGLQGEEILIHYTDIDTNNAGTFVTVKKYKIINKE